MINQFKVKLKINTNNTRNSCCVISCYSWPLKTHFHCVVTYSENRRCVKPFPFIKALPLCWERLVSLSLLITRACPLSNMEPISLKHYKGNKLSRDELRLNLIVFVKLPIHLIRRRENYYSETILKAIPLKLLT